MAFNFGGIDLTTIITAVRRIVKLIFGYVDEAISIMGIIRSIHKPVTDFIDSLMAIKQVDIDAETDPEAKHVLKLQATEDIVIAVDEEFSASPRWFPKELTWIYIKARMLFTKGEDGTTELGVEHGIANFEVPETGDEFVEHMKIWTDQK